EDLEDVIPSRCLTSVALGSPVAAQAVNGDRSQPGTKGPASLVVPKPGEIINHRGEHFLDKIVGIGLLRDVGGHPSPDQGEINVHDLPPGCRVAAVPGA